LDNKLDDYPDLHLDPQDDRDNWPDDVNPDSPLDPQDEFEDQSDDVEIDPLWNDPDNRAHPSCEHESNFIKWDKKVHVNEVWNEHGQPHEELDDW